MNKAFKPTTTRAKSYIVVRQWNDGEPVKTMPMSFTDAVRAQLHFERLGYDIVKMEVL